MSVVLIGFKSCGKSSTGRLLAQSFDFQFIDLDDVLEARYSSREGTVLSCREIFREHGESYFRSLEAEALESLTRRGNVVLATGGGAPMHEPNRPLLRQVGTVVYLKTAPELLFARFQAQGIPAFMAQDPTLPHLRELWAVRDAVYRQIADITIETGTRPVPEVAAEIGRRL